MVLGEAMVSAHSPVAGSIHCRQRDLPSIVLAGLKVFAAVVMKSIIFWDMTPCSPLS
jgi:hypothetical protein